MNSRSEQCALHCVRTPFTIHLLCLAFVLLLLLCIYCFFPRLISGRPRCCRRLHRCRVRLLRRRPYRYCRATRQAEPFSSPDIAYLFRTFLALGIVAAAMLLSYSLHSLSLSPLDVPSFILCCLINIYIYILFSSKS